MSVDGRTAGVMSTVRQLVEVFPARCLVRKPMNAMTIDDISRGDGIRSRRVSGGEVLSLVRVTGQRLLHCRDEKACDVYLPVNQRGLFSAISGHTAASVYSLRSLLAEFRLPITVRLVYGSLPIRDAATDALRLVGIQTDRVAFVLPLRHAWTSKSVDRRALVAVPSRQASWLKVASAARDFYCHWIASDDGLELTRRCNEIVASWKTSVHVVPSAVAAAAATAATSAAVSRGYEGDYATWSRGPLGNSVDSGLASSASAPCVAGMGTSFDDDDDDVDDLEREIEAIYETIRYDDNGLARLGRARSLDDCVSGGAVFSHTPTSAAYGARRPSVDALGFYHSPRVKPLKNKHQPRKVVDVARVDVARTSTRGAIDAGRQSSAFAGGDNVKLVSVCRRRGSVDADAVDSNAQSLDRDSPGVFSSSRRLSEPDWIIRGKSRRRGTEAERDSCEPDTSTTSNRSGPRRPRSKSLPESCVLTPEARGGKSHKSVLGTLTRSIANAFRRLRPHKMTHTFTIDTDLATAGSSERYIRKV